jgi:bifunctional non-homologous end joining protein LigD
VSPPRREVSRGAEMFRPMLATAGKDVPAGAEWVFEPKYDGIRIIALVTSDAVALLTRNGHDKNRGFPEVSDALRELARKLDRNLVIDGEIVALDSRGEPARFQDLQGRMHLQDANSVQDRTNAAPAAFVAFDLVVDGDELLIEEPWEARRDRLERVMRAAPAAVKRVVRISDVATDSPDRLLREARKLGWEGVMAKRRDCPYEPGRRVSHWRKLKMENQQEFVVGGWTEPRNSRKNLGALLLGYYDSDGNLVYAGHTGTGFSDAMLQDVGAKLLRIERAQSPFVTAPKTNERPHWAAPKYVAEVRFNEWTTDGRLRQPVFLGLRDDKDPTTVVREPPPVAETQQRASGSARLSPKRAAAAKASATAPSAKRQTAKANSQRPTANGQTHAAKRRTPNASGQTPNAKRLARGAKATPSSSAPLREQLRANAKAAGATIQIDSKTKLDVTNLGKLFFPVAKVTKGRLLEFYAEVSPYLLPALEDRPLVLKRYPNGIKEEAFYQQKAPDKVPAGVRVELVADDGITPQRRLIGGNLATLLYIVQLGAVSTDPWHSRVQSIADADYSIVDLDPGPKATFKRVIQVARWVKEELDELGLHGVAKTSGASGIHIVLPLPRGASYEISRVLAELVARRVNEKHPRETTVHRWVKSRPADSVYVDYLQNIRGKTVASVYSARAEPHASVSTPLKWTELTNDLDPRDFTVETLPKRLKRVGDLWAAGLKKLNRLPGIVGDAAA